MEPNTMSSAMLLLEFQLWPAVVEFMFRDLVVLGHACTDAGCSRIAEWTCYWPGEHRAQCTAHKLGWEHVAAVMGFELISTPLSVRQWPEPDASSARFAAMELF